LGAYGFIFFNDFGVELGPVHFPGQCLTRLTRTDDDDPSQTLFLDAEKA
jgi:hypothetical protein